MHARTLVNLYSQNPSAYLTLEDDKLLYFGHKVDGVIPYGVVGSTIVINGDPICADSDFPVLLAEFKRILPAQRSQPVFISVTDHFWKNIRSRALDGSKRGRKPVSTLRTMKSLARKAPRCG